MVIIDTWTLERHETHTEPSTLVNTYHLQGASACCCFPALFWPWNGACWSAQVWPLHCRWHRSPSSRWRWPGSRGPFCIPPLISGVKIANYLSTFSRLAMMSDHDFHLKEWLKPFQCANACLNEKCACHKVSTWGERASGSAFVLHSQLVCFFTPQHVRTNLRALFSAAAGSCHPQMSSGNHRPWFARNQMADTYRLVKV